MLFGHLALADIAKQTACKAESFVFLFLASYAPDLIDKPLRVAMGLNGRGFGHSLLCFALALALAGLLHSRGRLPLRLIAVGASLWTLHLVFDLATPTTLLWPFLGPLPPQAHLSLLQLIKHYASTYIDPEWQLILFMDLAAILAAVSLRLKTLVQRKRAQAAQPSPNP